MTKSEAWKRALLKHVPDEESIFERIKRYRKEGLEHHERDVKDFIRAIKRGEFPEKCLECYKSGIAWCKFWSSGFNCEVFDKKIVGEKNERLL